MRLLIATVLLTILVGDGIEREPKPYCHEHICDWTKAFYCLCGEVNIIERIPGVGLACRCP